MNNRSQILAVIALCSALGLFKADDIINSLNKNKALEITSNENIALVKAAGEIAQNTADLQAARNKR